MMANGEMVKILSHTDVTRYLEFKQIAGSYVYRDGRISKVPSNEVEAVMSSLMGLFEKRRAKKFFEWVQGWKEDNLATHQGLSLDQTPMSAVYAKFGLELGTQDFIGHAMALHLDDSCVSLISSLALISYSQILMSPHCAQILEPTGARNVRSYRPLHFLHGPLR